jgi:ABC-2 type transport system ATP-binding protein
MAELVIDQVGKRFEPERWALRDVSLRLERGVLGLVGPNGAGKTTLLRMLATLLVPTEGSIAWDGVDVVRRPMTLRKTLGYVPQDVGVYPQLTAREFLSYIGELKGLARDTLTQRVGDVLDMVHLSADADRRLKTFSGGMIQRVGIAQALLYDPQLLVLDEPTAGLDPAERMRFREILASLPGDRLVILSTHIITDVEAIVTDLAIISRGRLKWRGTPAGLIADAEGGAWSLTVKADEFDHLRATYRVSAAVRSNDVIDARLVGIERPHPMAQAVAPTLEEAYLLFAPDEDPAAATSKE